MLAGFISLCTFSLPRRYDTAQTTSDTITFPIPGKLSKIFSSLIYDKNLSNELTFLSALDGSKSNSHNSKIN